MATARRAQERQARNIDEGWQIELDCEVHGKIWVEVVGALHITAPLGVTSFTVKALDEQCTPCVGDGKLPGCRPDTPVMSRRLAHATTQGGLR